MSLDKQTWRADAPANLALIKYMGKADLASNLPSNGSISLTLEHLRTFVEIELSSGARDEWKPLRSEAVEEISLSAQGQERFLKHFERLKFEWQIPGHYVVRSANNFPSDCGLASSASSFAALTLATFELAKERSLDREAVETLTRERLSEFSQSGSGSSCRSFFSPWALWRERGAMAVVSPLKFLFHQVAVLEDAKKLVSSSDAHRRVVESELFQGRPTRAEKRLQEFLDALNVQDWQRLHQLTWADFWDMHALFETSKPAFGYMTSGSMKVLDVVREVWRDRGDGPLVTMDAGPNVHLLYRQDQAKMARWLSGELASFCRVIESPELREERVW